MKFFWTLLGFFITTSSVLADNITVIPDAKTSDLGKKIQSGDVQLYDLPEYIKYLTDGLVWLAGYLAVFVVIFAGYKYFIGGFTDSTDEAKSTLQNVVIGLIIAIFAWMIVDLIVRLITA